jgi:hypothetical protein
VFEKCSAGTLAETSSILTEVVYVFPESLQAKAKTVSRSGHDVVLPNPFQIIHLSSGVIQSLHRQRLKITVLKHYFKKVASYGSNNRSSIFGIYIQIFLLDIMSRSAPLGLFHKVKRPEREANYLPV